MKTLLVGFGVVGRPTVARPGDDRHVGVQARVVGQGLTKPLLHTTLGAFPQLPHGLQLLAGRRSQPSSRVRLLGGAADEGN